MYIALIVVHDLLLDVEFNHRLSSIHKVDVHRTDKETNLCKVLSYSVSDTFLDLFY